MDMHHLVAKRPPFGCRDPHPVLAAALPARRERSTSADKAMEGVVPADTAGVRQHHAHGGAGVAGRCGQDHDLSSPAGPWRQPTLVRASVPRLHRRRSADNRHPR